MPCLSALVALGPFSKQSNRAIYKNIPFTSAQVSVNSSVWTDEYRTGSGETTTRSLPLPVLYLPTNNVFFAELGDY
jgi:hypothetical protein